MATPSLSYLLHADPAMEPAASYVKPDSGTLSGTSPSQASDQPSNLYSVPTPQRISEPLSSPNDNESQKDQGQTPTLKPSGNGHAAMGSLYQCAHCQRRYSRPEHLARHIQTHTLGKRFFCPVCDKGFARADLLKRHAANHGNDDGTKKRRRTDANVNAGRVSHACKSCAAARVKCEEVKPCTRCRNRSLTCEYASSEAGSQAAMHLLHLSSNPRTDPDQVLQISPELPSESVAMAYQNPMAIASIQQYPDGTSTIPNSALRPDEAQMPTPETLVDHRMINSYRTNYPTSGEPDSAHVPFSDFLRDVLYEQSLSSARPEEAQGLAVLDFCDDVNYDLTDIDFGLLGHWNLDGTNDRPSVTQAATPQSDDSTVDMAQMRQRLVKIWADSPWRWIPNSRDNGYGEHSHIPLSSRDAASKFQESQKDLDRVVKGRLEASGRDKILATVLASCRNDTTRIRVASSFPSVELADLFIHIFLAAHLCSVSTWIHMPTFAINTQWPEWLGMAAASGAILTPVPTLRRFGFAIQEAVRIALPGRFEENNTGIKDLGLVQTLIVTQDIGLWCGNRRKMELAESHTLIPITMMRYRGKFLRSSYPVIAVDPKDEGEVLEEKWKSWIEAESWKRLVFHCHVRDAQVSMTTLSNPVMCYAELTLPLPEAKELWFAKSAEEWKAAWLILSAGRNKRPPSLCDLIRDINLLVVNQQRVDLQYAISTYLYGLWNLIFEWRKSCAIHRSSSPSANYSNGSNLLLNSRKEELYTMLQNFQLITSSWQETFSAQEALLLSLMSMNLHCSLDDLQLFAGKEGEDQARRIYPFLQQWVDSPEARHALWHAGQVLRYAKLFPAGHLKDFFAVAVHHAALLIWTYAVVTKATRHATSQEMPQDVVHIDVYESTETQRFVQIGHGRPALQGIRSQHGQQIESSIEDPQTCMDVVQEILRANFSGGKDMLPPIVENLCMLIKQLGGAAWAVGL